MTRCNEKQLGLIIEGALAFDRLGRGYNTGYGHVEVKQLQLLKRQVKKTPVIAEDGSFTIEKTITEESLDKLFSNALAVWQDATKA